MHFCSVAKFDVQIGIESEQKKNPIRIKIHHVWLWLVAVSYPKIVIKIHRHDVYIFVPYRLFEPTSQINLLAIGVENFIHKTEYTHTEHMKQRTHEYKHSNTHRFFLSPGLTNFSLFQDSHTCYTKTSASLIYILIYFMYWTHLETQNKCTCFCFFILGVRNKIQSIRFNSSCELFIWSRAHHFWFNPFCRHIVHIRYGAFIYSVVAAAAAAAFSPGRDND